MPISAINALATTAKPFFVWLYFCLYVVSKVSANLTINLYRDLSHFD